MAHRRARVLTNKSALICYVTKSQTNGRRKAPQTRRRVADVGGVSALWVGYCSVAGPPRAIRNGQKVPWTRNFVYFIIIRTKIKSKGTSKSHLKYTGCCSAGHSLRCGQPGV
ncbi:hypothetical protein E2C01_055960 [Portunus trituberculatus]|uniref:Uncharacterized protein n=1 Tax=Portunus trituberculatus TaxID=210409 RepID=A0A5B7GW51_PORTR|nr:hypothetical protein [Portunus trituberculatus]